jgi:hypothetical protein
VAEWRPIPGFPAYEASDEGEVRAIKARYRDKQGAPLVPWIVERHGREAAYVQLGRGNKELVHRLVCLAFHGEPPLELTDCCHKDHNSLNNRASNLKWGTHSENIEEQWEKRKEMETRLSDALGDPSCYTGPDRHSDVPF